MRFEVGTADENSSIIAGISVTVNQHFDIKKIERLYSNWGRYSRNKPVIREKIPIHPDGQQVSWRKSHLISCMGDMRHYEYNNTEAENELSELRADLAANPYLRY